MGAASSTTDEIVLRVMAAEDFPQVDALWQKTEGMGLDPVMDGCESVCAYLQKNPGMSWVAVCGERIIGTVLAGTDGRRGYLMHLAVEKLFRGRGLGRALVDHSVQALAAAGIYKVHIFVFNQNIEGQAFWQRLGWQGRDDLLMFSHEQGSCDKSC